MYGNFAVCRSHSILSKPKNKFVLHGAIKCSRNSIEVGQIWSTTSLLQTKVNNNLLFGCFKVSRNKKKLFVHAVLPNCLFLRLYWRCGNRGYREILIGIQQFVCQKSSMNCVERTIMTTLTVTQQINPLIFFIQ